MGLEPDHESPKNYETLKEFVDLSAEMNWEYSLVDAKLGFNEGWQYRTTCTIRGIKGGGYFDVVQFGRSAK